MANIKISELPAASAGSGTQEFEVNDSGTSKKVTGAQVKAYVKSGLVVTDVTDLTASAAELNYTDGVTSNIQTQLNSKAPTASPVFSGNMGIGTSAPTLNSAGTFTHINATGSNAAAVHLTNGTTGAAADDGMILARWNDGNNYLWVYENESLHFGTNNTERLRIAASGAVGLSGANYGTSGQVLTSNGSGSAVTWQNLSSAQVGAATAGLALGAVGTYALLSYSLSNGTFVEGTLIAGSSLLYSGYRTSNNPPANAAYGVGLGASPAGTWMVVGAARTNGSANWWPASVFLRIS